MDAWLFAAGNGMRLRPLTNDFQKCLLPVLGKPMLEWWLDAVFRSKIFDRVYVNVHHMADQVSEWVTKYSRRRNREVIIIDERTKLLGTAGTLYLHAEPDRDFMTVYTDTFSQAVLVGDGLIRLYDDWGTMRSGMLAGLVSFKSPEDLSAGRIITDGRRNVIGFKEKSSGRGLVWSGIMFADREVLSLIEETDKDLASDILPRLCYKMVTVGLIDAYDIGRGLKYYDQLNRKESSVS